VDSCAEASGNCIHAKIQSDLACDDSNECTTDDTCMDGSCKGAKKICDDGDPCTADSCDTESGCNHDRASMQDQACQHENRCALNPRCQDGSCAAQAFRLCSDNDSCTEVSCDEHTGLCVGTVPSDVIGKQCDDGNSCTSGETCAEDGCRGAFDPGLLGCGSGDTCENAIELPSQAPLRISGSTVGMKDAYKANQCRGDSYSGAGTAPDIAYRYTAPKEGAYSFALDAKFGAYLYISADCPPAKETCVRQLKDEIVESSMIAGDSVFLIVDGTALGNEGELSLDITVRPEEVSCDDRFDNDGDGAKDCDDDDCRRRGECGGNGNTCGEALTLPSGLPGSIEIPFGGDNSTDNWRISDCEEGWSVSAARQDRVLSFVAPDDGYYAILVQPGGTDFNTELYVSLSCPPSIDGCLGAADQTLGHGGEVLTVELLKGQEAFAFVDGFRAITTGAGGKATLRVERVETDCFDGKDEDGDGAMDCEDSDCAVRPACLPPIKPGPGDLLVIEVMGNPYGVSDLDGEWVEVVNVSDRRVELQSVHLGYAKGIDATSPDARSRVDQSFVLPPFRPAILGRNLSKEENGGLGVDLLFRNFHISNNGPSSLFLIGPEWDGSSPLSEAHLIDRVAFTGDVFGVRAVGRSWQVSQLNDPYEGYNDEPGYNDQPGSWCATPAEDEYEYGDDWNFGRPHENLVDCSAAPDLVHEMTYSDVLPMLQRTCASCHTTDGSGDHNMASVYEDAHSVSTSCPGKPVYECALIRVKEGDMPPNKGCTGDPLLDASRPACLTEYELDTMTIWVYRGGPNNSSSGGM
jgi:hypothetical protein